MIKGVLGAMADLKMVREKHGAGAFDTAVHALRIQSNRPEVSTAMAIKLADRLEKLSLRYDEPRFTTEDYIDAVCSDQFSQGDIKTLCGLNDDDFDECVIVGTERERQRYE